jgi:hypothetical protein
VARNINHPVARSPYNARKSVAEVPEPSAKRVRGVDSRYNEEREQLIKYYDAKLARLSEEITSGVEGHRVGTSFHPEQVLGIDHSPWQEQYLLHHRSVTPRRSYIAQESGSILPLGFTNEPEQDKFELLKLQLNETSKQKEYLENEIKRLRNSFDLTEEALKRAEVDRRALEMKYESVLKQKTEHATATRAGSAAEESVKALNEMICRERDAAIYAEERYASLQVQHNQMQQKLVLANLELERQSLKQDSGLMYADINGSNDELILQISRLNSVLREKDRIIKQLQKSSNLKVFNEQESGTPILEKDWRKEVLLRDSKIETLQKQIQLNQKQHADELEELNLRFEVRLQAAIVAVFEIKLT